MKEKDLKLFDYSTIIIDYIFASALFNKINYRVIKTVKGSNDLKIYPSDHYIIMSIL